MQDATDVSAAAYAFDLEKWDEIDNGTSLDGFANLSDAQDVTDMLALIGHSKGSRRLEATEDL